MSPVQWRPSRGRQPILGFLKVPPRRVVSLLEAPDTMVALTLHWQEAARNSIPCMGEECLLCASSPKKIHVYTIVMHFDTSARTWSAAILDCGVPGGRLSSDDLVGEIIVVDRHKAGAKAGWVDHAGTLTNAQVPPPPVTERMDVRPYLMRRFGLYDEADYFASLPYVEQGRLKFPGVSDEEESA